MKIITPSLKKSFILLSLISFQTTFCQISGTKIIGTAPSDYTTFNDAVADLVSLGVNGPVVFDVKPGIYQEQIFIPSINGASATNTITFQSQNEDSTSAELRYSPYSYSDNYTIWLYAANYITFRELTISSNGILNYSNVIVIDSLAGNNTFSNNVIWGTSSNQADVDQALIYSSDFDEDNNVFTKNRFFYGSYGIYYYGTSNKEHGTIITDNVFEYQYYNAIYLSNQDAPTISGNIIYCTTYTTSSSFRAIHCQYCDDHMIISKNKIILSNTFGGYGMYITNCESSSGNESLISNNFIRINTDNSICYGIYCSSSNFQKFFNNSINITGTYYFSSAFGFEGYGSDGLQIKNNIFSNHAGGYAIYCFLSTTLFASDYNDFYSTGTNLCNYYGDVPTLAAWIAVASNDIHTKNIDPDFVSDSDLHCSALSLASAALQVTDVSDDIDGELRGSTPDIGADEFEFTGITSYPDEQNIYVFPNPSSDILHICFTDKAEREISIFDYCGRALKVFTSAETDISINLSDISEGYYFLCIRNSKEERYFPFEKSGN